MTNTAFVESNVTSSPDGRSIAYQSNESGTQGDDNPVVFSRAWLKQQVSTKGGILPRWAPNGTELFYVTPTSTLMSVSLKSAGAGLQVAIPGPLFSLPAFQAGGDYDVSADGRFLVHVMDTERPPFSVTVVLNWARRLKNSDLVFETVSKARHTSALASAVANLSTRQARAASCATRAPTGPSAGLEHEESSSPTVVVSGFSRTLLFHSLL